MTDINNNDAVHESDLDAPMYDGDQDHLDEFTAEAANAAQECINSAGCDVNSASGSVIIDTIDENDDLKEMLFKWLNVGTPLCDRQRAFIQALEKQLAQDYES